MSAEPVLVRVSTEDLELLQLLMQDLRDADIAERLFVSVRTLRRRIDGLMERTGSPNRFALGVVAAANGWVRPTDASI